jgi:Ca-activated chloride channel family protein
LPVFTLTPARFWAQFNGQACFPKEEDMSMTLSLPNPNCSGFARPVTGLAGLLAAAFVAVISMSGAAQAQEQDLSAFTGANPATATSGGLYLKTGDGYIEATRLATDIDLAIHGPTIRGTVTQAFRNQSDHWIEAVYAYPLSEGAAVDSLTMIVGDRVIVGEIQEREQARATYEAAREAGVRAGLVEQHRPNLFTNSVANIGPGETVLIQIAFQEPVRIAEGEFSVRVPLVVGPKYGPPVVDEGSTGVRVLDPPVVDPELHGRINPVSLSIDLDAGFDIASLESATHNIAVSGTGAVRTVGLAGGEVPADRDFVLTWSATPRSVPAVRVYSERVEGEDYILAFVTPPASNDQEPAPREVVFVIDNSGSMSGESMRQARRGLLYALAQLTPQDRFNVIRFDNTMESLFPDTVPASSSNLVLATRFVSALDANGGTNMSPAMREALRDPRPNDDRYVRQVVFITDGAIGYERDIFNIIASDLGRSRVFMVGIGSAPNSHLMSRAAEIGRGTFTHIDSVDQVDFKMRALNDKLLHPAATGLALELDGVRADFTPQLLPDLYKGEPLVLAAKVDSLGGGFRLSGQTGGRPWNVDVRLSAAVRGEGVSKVWANRTIADAEARSILGETPREDADAEVLKLGLEHGIVTRMTSLVAVDKTPARPAGYRLVRADLPINLPAGWNFEALFGGPSPEKPMADVQAAQEPDQVDLPQGGTLSGLLAIGGVLLALIGVAILKLGRFFRREGFQ